MGNKQIKYGAVISYGGLMINIILSLIYTPWMVTQIGKSNYALYTLATSFISIFIMDFGLSSSVSRFVAKYRAEGSNNKINIFVSTIFRLYIFVSLLIAIVLIILFFFLDKIYVGLTADELSTFRVLYIIVAINSIVSFPCMPFSGIISAYEKFIQLKFCELFQKLFSVALIVCALLLGMGVTAIVSAQVISGFVTIAIKIFIIKKKINLKISMRFFDKVVVKEAFSFSIWITIISLAQRAIFNLAPTILGIVSTSEEIAIFSPANALEGYFYMFAAAVNGLFLPTISRYIAQNKENHISDLMIKIGRYQLVVLGLVLVGFLCAGKDFMCAWMGESFVMAWPCALLMFLPDYFLFSQQIANTTITAKNKVKYQSLGYIGMGVICIIFSMILCKRWGALGSGIAITISYFCLFVYMNIIYIRILDLDMKRFYKECYGKLLIPIIIVGFVSFLICSRINFESYWTNVIIKAMITIIIYMVIIWKVITKEERDLILKMLHVKKNA